MLLSLETVKHLARPRPLLTWGHLLMEWSLVLAAIAVVARHPEPWVILLAMVWIGGRQLGLLELMHGCIHWSLFRNSRLNDLVGEGLLAWPLFEAIEPARQRHLAHHRYLNTLADPEWDPRPEGEPSPAGRLQRHLVELTGLGSLRRGLHRLRHPVPVGQRLKRGPRVLRALAFATVLGTAIATGTTGWLLLWIVPRFTWVPFVRSLRDTLEHSGMHDRVPAQRTRSIHVDVVLATFVLPKHAGLHEAHHLYPSVPFHALPVLQSALRMGDGVRESESFTIALGIRRRGRSIPMTEGLVKSGTPPIAPRPAQFSTSTAS